MTSQIAASVTILPRANQVTFDSPHTVTLPLLDWLTLRTNMGFACHMLNETGSPETAAVLEGTLARLCEQTQQAIDDAADAEEIEQ